MNFWFIAYVQFSAKMAVRANLGRCVNETLGSLFTLRYEHLKILENRKADYAPHPGV